MAVGLPDACLTTNAAAVLAASEDGNTPQWDPTNGHCDATYSWLRNRGASPEHLRLTAGIPHAGFLILHLRNYAAWQIRVNGRLVAFGADRAMARLPQREDGLMAVPVPAGQVEIAIDWTTTRNEVIGRWLSALALVLLAGLFWLERRISPRSSRLAQPA
jgi:hypothetical protein